MPDYIPNGEAIVKARTDAGFSHVGLGTLVGVQGHTIARWESESGNIRQRNLWKLARVLGKSEQSLVKGKARPKSQRNRCDVEADVEQIRRLQPLYRWFIGIDDSIELQDALVEPLCRLLCGHLRREQKSPQHPPEWLALQSVLLMELAWMSPDHRKLAWLGAKSFEELVDVRVPGFEFYNSTGAKVQPELVHLYRHNLSNRSSHFTECLRSSPVPNSVGSDSIDQADWGLEPLSHVKDKTSIGLDGWYEPPANQYNYQLSTVISSRSFVKGYGFDDYCKNRLKELEDRTCGNPAQIRHFARAKLVSSSGRGFPPQDMENCLALIQESASDPRFEAIELVFKMNLFESNKEGATNSSGVPVESLLDVSDEKRRFTIISRERHLITPSVRKEILSKRMELFPTLGYQIAEILDVPGEVASELH